MIVLLITLYVIGVLVFLVTSDSFVASNQDSGLSLDVDLFALGHDVLLVLFHFLFV